MYYNEYFKKPTLLQFVKPPSDSLLIIESVPEKAATSHLPSDVVNAISQQSPTYI